MARLFDDGSSEYLSAASAPATAAPLSISFWFNCDEGGSDQVPVSLYADNNNYFAVLLNSSGGVEDKIRAYISDNGGDDYASTTGNWTVNTWQHAMAVYANSTSRAAFLNGGSKGTNATDITPAGIDTLNLGRWAGGANYYSGTLAEVGLWNAVLTDAEVGILAAGFSPLLVRPASLVAYWPLVRTLQDFVGGYDLSATGTAVSVHPPTVRYPVPLFVGVPTGGGCTQVTATVTVTVTVTVTEAVVAQE